MYRCCIFDLDGTLLDTIHALAYTTNLVLKRLGLKTGDEEHLKHFVGDGYRTQMERCLKYAGDPELTHYEESLPLYMEEFAKHCLYQVQPYPGILEMTGFLKEKGVKLAVLSNKPHENTENVIHTVFEEGVFDWIQGQSDAFPRKPDPAGALYIAEQFGVKPEECMYMGDTGTDMQTGTAAHMYTVGVEWGFRDAEELQKNGANVVVKKAEELIEIYRKGSK